MVTFEFHTSHGVSVTVDSVISEEYDPVSDTFRLRDESGTDYGFPSKSFLYYTRKEYDVTQEQQEPSAPTPETANGDLAYDVASKPCNHDLPEWEERVSPVGG